MITGMACSSLSSLIRLVRLWPVHLGHLQVGNHNRKPVRWGPRPSLHACSASTALRRFGNVRRLVYPALVSAVRIIWDSRMESSATQTGSLRFSRLPIASTSLSWIPVSPQSPPQSFQNPES